MNMNWRMSRIAFIVVCGAGTWLAEPRAAIAGCASGNVAAADLLSSPNCQATALGTNATAVGRNATAGTNATSLGVASGSNTEGVTSIGAFTNLGLFAPGIYSTAIGAGVVTSNTAAYSGGDYSVAIGGGDGTAAGGTGAMASATGSIAIGNQSIASNSSATAVGRSATASGQQATAMGVDAQATALFTSALGSSAKATANSATAVGSNTTAGFTNSTAIGNGATTTAVNQIAVGTASNTYTMSGITSAASTAAQTGPTKIVTTDAFGNLAAANFSQQDISTLQSSVGGLQQNVSLLQQTVSALQTQMRQGFEGTAIAIALGGAALPSDKRFAISTNWGNFRGQNAVGVAAQLRLTNYAVANVGVGGGFAQGGIGSRAGVTFAW